MSPKHNSHRRTVIKALGVAGTSLAGLSGSAAAKPDNDKSKGKSKGRPEEHPGKGEGEGKGRWCRGEGRGRGRYRGPGYDRDHPHSDDETRWDDDVEVGDPADSDDDDEDEDESEDDEGEYEDSATGIVRVLDQDGNPVEGEPVTLSPPGTVDDSAKEVHQTNEDGEVVIELLAGEPEDVVMFGVEVRDQSGYLAVMSDEHAGVQEVEFVVDTSDDEDESDEDEDEDNESEVLITTTDAETGDPVEDAHVTISTADVDPDDIQQWEFETDDEGRVEEDIEVGNFILEVEADGYEDYTAEVGLEHEHHAELTPSEGGEDPESVEEQIESRIHAEVNAYREENDRESLEFSDELAEVARQHSADMTDRDYFGHTSPDGSGPGDRLDDADIDCDGWAENIAYEFDPNFSDEDAQSVANSITQGWIDSEGHRENILGDYSEQGIGVVVSDGTIMATQVFCSQ